MKHSKIIFEQILLPIVTCKNVVHSMDSPMTLLNLCAHEKMCNNLLYTTYIKTKLPTYFTPGSRVSCEFVSRRREGHAGWGSGSSGVSHERMEAGGHRLSEGLTERAITKGISRRRPSVGRHPIDAVDILGCRPTGCESSIARIGADLRPGSRKMAGGKSSAKFPSPCAVDISSTF